MEHEGIGHVPESVRRRRSRVNHGPVRVGRDEVDDLVGTVLDAAHRDRVAVLVDEEVSLNRRRGGERRQEQRREEQEDLEGNEESSQYASAHAKHPPGHEKVGHERSAGKEARRDQCKRGRRGA
ncbi:MAG TPA: hypothetical protein VK613_10885 [Gaiellaceae bacterium]|nr:hypothetical protein [Gaiellaceae bacterium]